jgi:hypothetical protein
MPVGDTAVEPAAMMECGLAFALGMVAFALILALVLVADKMMRKAMVMAKSDADPISALEAEAAALRRSLDLLQAFVDSEIRARKGLMLDSIRMAWHRKRTDLNAPADTNQPRGSA